MDKSALTERDICTKFILPAVKRAGWDEMVQVREEVYLTKVRIIVRGKLVTRGKLGWSTCTFTLLPLRRLKHNTLHSVAFCRRQKL
jgi:hypothetical protein